MIDRHRSRQDYSLNIRSNGVTMFDLSKYKKLNRYVRMAVLFYHQHPTRALEMIIVHCLGKLRNITGIEMTINLSTR